MNRKPRKTAGASSPENSGRKRPASPKQTPADPKAKHSRPPKAAKAAPVVTEKEPGFPVVGIGASAGGLEALELLLENMQLDTGMAFVVVTHQHPGHTSMLPELLSKTTACRWKWRPTG